MGIEDFRFGPALMEALDKTLADSADTLLERRAALATAYLRGNNPMKETLADMALNDPERLRDPAKEAKP